MALMRSHWTFPRSWAFYTVRLANRDGKFRLSHACLIVAIGNTSRSGASVKDSNPYLR